MGDAYLKGRAAWVTGAASGIGRGIALALAGAGADVALGTLVEADRLRLAAGQTADILSPADIEETRASIAAHGVGALVKRLDVRRQSSVAAFHRAMLDRFGKVDILVNAAYAGGKHPISGHPDELWHALVETNVTGAYRTIRLCLPGMIARRWGRIINIGSTAATTGSAGSAAYCASKAALLGLTRCVALEGAAHGISCNTLSPGWVRTRQSRAAYAYYAASRPMDQFLAEAIEAIPQKRLLEPSEIGAYAAFLCRDEALGITMENMRQSAGALW